MKKMKLLLSVLLTALCLLVFTGCAYDTYYVTLSISSIINMVLEIGRFVLEVIVSVYLIKVALKWLGL